MIANKRQNNLKDFLVLHSFLDFSAFFLDRSPLGTRLDKDFSHIKGLGHLQWCAYQNQNDPIYEVIDLFLT